MLRLDGPETSKTLKLRIGNQRIVQITLELTPNTAKCNWQGLLSYYDW